MAVEKLKVIARIKTLFPKANLSQKRLDALADKLATKPADDADDDAIDAVINDFNSILSIDEIAREDDRVRTLETKANPPAPAPSPTPTNPQPTNPNPTDDVNQKLLEAITKLTGEVEAIKTGKVIETKKATAQEAFNASETFKKAPKEVQDFMFKNIDLNSETPFEEQVKSLETTYGTLVQVSADNNQYGGPAGNGSNNTKPDDAVVNSIVDNLNI